MNFTFLGLPTCLPQLMHLAIHALRYPSPQAERRRPSILFELIEWEKSHESSDAFRCAVIQKIISYRQTDNTWKD